jgi:hypothetical protein
MRTVASAARGARREDIVQLVGMGALGWGPAGDRFITMEANLMARTLDLQHI